MVMSDQPDTSELPRRAETGQIEPTVALFQRHRLRLKQMLNALPTGDALKNVISLEVEPRSLKLDRFSGSSKNAWYLFARPQDMPLVAAFQEWRRSPTLAVFGFDADPTCWKLPAGNPSIASRGEEEPRFC